MEFNRTFDARLVTSVVACGIMSFSGVVVETSMNVTFPTLMAEFSVGTSTVQWITTGYLLVLSLMIPLSSFFKRTFKLKSLFIFSACTFLAGTLLSALAPSFAVLLGVRGARASEDERAEGKRDKGDPKGVKLWPFEF